MVPRGDMGTQIIDLRPTELALESKAGNQIANFINRNERVPYGDFLLMNDYIRQYSQEIHRPWPSRKYNCHGLSFAARRTAIESPIEIAKIIADDDYEEVIASRVIPGDIAIYYESGDASHSGIVVQMTELKVPIVLSKWGHCHEVVHHLSRCPYKSDDIRFYRMRS